MINCFPFRLFITFTSFEEKSTEKFFFFGKNYHDRKKGIIDAKLISCSFAMYFLVTQVSQQSRRRLDLRQARPFRIALVSQQKLNNCRVSSQLTCEKFRLLVAAKQKVSSYENIITCRRTIPCRLSSSRFHSCTHEFAMTEARKKDFLCVVRNDFFIYSLSTS